MKHRLGSSLRIFVGRIAGIAGTVEVKTRIQSRMKNRCLFGALIVGVISASRPALSCSQAGFLYANGFSQCIL